MCSSKIENTMVEIVLSLCVNSSAVECVHMHPSSIVKSVKLKWGRDSLNECVNGLWHTVP